MQTNVEQMREFWSKIGSKIDPKIDAKIDAKIESVQKAQVPENPGPGVPVRGKEFLPETPGSRFAIANHHHTNNHQASK